MREGGRGFRYIVGIGHAQDEDMRKRKYRNICTDCSRDAAVTNDGRLCLGCLRKRINEMNPPVERSGGFSNMRRERSLNLTTLGGQAEMLGDGDDN